MSKLEHLSMFTGSEQWYRHALNRKVLFTDGAKYVADQAGAYWLLDEIAFAQLGERAVKSEPFQLWKLEVRNHAAQLICEDGNGQQKFTKHITFTDFPEPGIRFYFTDNTILLPSEY